ncbi:MAG: hypothetical protein HN742_33070 [Lentisphaerae bacterium]|nr:hypothetical protein [Lentisphaerota bacterium]MBT5608255.1 hypothetical protein [Lentisphaerota bacterium]MBT7061191.1 hypothetical protein [Lentisphaerota bacterium]MBT7846749.1 hypothetical protein [Lentisphaerota bacterium]
MRSKFGWSSGTLTVALLLLGVARARAVLYSESGASSYTIRMKTSPGGAVQLLPNGDFGLAVDDDVDALSLGNDPYPGETSPVGPRLDVFAVAPGSTGTTPGGALTARAAMAGACVECDVYRASHTFNEVLIPGLIPDGAIDAFEASNLVDTGDETHNAWIYFSLAPGSPTLAARGWQSNDILMVQYKNAGTLRLFADAVAFGSPSEVDAVSVRDAVRDGNVYDPTADVLIYSASLSEDHCIYHYGYGAPGDHKPHAYPEFGIEHSGPGVGSDNLVALEHIFFRQLVRRLPLKGVEEENGASAVCYSTGEVTHLSPPDNAHDLHAYHKCASRDTSPAGDHVGEFGCKGNPAGECVGFSRLAGALEEAGMTFGDIAVRWTPGTLANDLKGDNGSWGDPGAGDWWFDPDSEVELRRYSGASGKVYLDGTLIAEYPDFGNIWMRIDWQQGAIRGWTDAQHPVVSPNLQPPHSSIVAAFLEDHAEHPARLYFGTIESPIQVDFNAGVPWHQGAYFDISDGELQVLTGTDVGSAGLWDDLPEGGPRLWIDRDVVVLNQGRPAVAGVELSLAVPLRNDGTAPASVVTLTLFPSAEAANLVTFVRGRAFYGTLGANTQNVLPMASRGDNGFAIILTEEALVRGELPLQAIIMYDDGTFARDDFLVTFANDAAAWTGSLAGEWSIGGSDLQNDLTWTGTVTFDTSGNVTGGAITSSAGSTHTIVSGGLTVSALGEVTGSFTDNRAVAVTTTFTMQMDSGQGTMAGEGNASPAESEDGAFVFIKKSSQFALDPDLVGTWFIGGSDLQDNHTWDGELTIDTTGNVTGGTYNSSEGGTNAITGGSFSVGADGAVTGHFIDDDGGGTPVTTNLTLQMDYRKGIMAGPGKTATSTEEGMFAFVKKVAQQFVTADLEGTWFLGGSSLEEEDTWDAFVTLDNTGTVVAPFSTYNCSDGGPQSAITSGSFTIGADGSVTGTLVDTDAQGDVTTAFTLQMNDEKDMMGGEGNVTLPLADDEDGFFMFVKRATPPPALPDVVVADISIPNTVIVQGASPATWVSFTVTNIGPEPVTGVDLKAGIVNATRDGAPFVMGGYMTVPYTDPMATGDEADYSFAVGHDAMWPVGSYIIHVKADLFGDIDEQNENNNVSVPLAFEVVSAPPPEVDVASLPVNNSLPAGYFLYVTNEGDGGGGTTVVQIADDGTATVVGTGFNGPSGLAEDTLAADPLLYVSDDTGSAYSQALSDLFSTVETGFSNPNALYFDADNNDLYIADAGDKIILLDLDTLGQAVLAQGYGIPQAVVRTTSGVVYFTDDSGDVFVISPGDTLPLDAVTNPATVLASAVAPGTGGGLVIDAAEATLYVADYADGKVFEVTIADGNVTELIDFANFAARGLALSADGGTLYITGYLSDEIVAYDLTAGTASLFADTVSTGALLDGPFGMVISTNDYLPFSAGNTTPQPADCIDFEDLTLATQYVVGDTFTTCGADVTAAAFQWSNGLWTSDGYAQVDNQGFAGGSGQDMWANNITLEIDFGSPVPGIIMRYGEHGGNLNIEINGTFQEFEDFADIDGTVIGGSYVAVQNVVGDLGELTVAGPVNSFAIGGQELWIDDICPGEVVAPNDTLHVSAASPGMATGTGTNAVAVTNVLPIAEGAAREFSVVAAGGTAPYHYQWQLNSVAVGDDSPSFVFAPGYDTVLHPAVESAPLTLVCSISDSAVRAVATVTWAEGRVVDVSRCPSLGGVIAEVTPDAWAEDGQDLVCVLTGAATDEDTEDLPSLRYRYVWRTALGTVLRDVTTTAVQDTLPSAVTPTERILTCAVTAVDQMNAVSPASANSNAVAIVPDGELWRLRINVTGGQVDNVVIGMNSTATHGFDTGIDWGLPPDGYDGARSVALQIPSDDLAHDFRPVADETRWLLRIEASDVPVELGWDNEAVPEEGLLMVEVDSEGNPIPDGIARRMAQSSSLTIPAGTATHLAIDYAEALSFSLSLRDGWNLVSSPIMPIDPDAGTVFSGCPVWSWANGVYAQPTDIMPGEGYWVYYSAPTPGGTTMIDVRGRPATSVERATELGWNMIGPIGLPPYNEVPASFATIPASVLAAPLWGWDGAKYEAVFEWVSMGSAYWGYASSTCTVRLGEELVGAVNELYKGLPGDVQRTRVHITFPEPELEEWGGWTTPVVPGFSFGGEPGQPRLPRKVYRVVLPPNVETDTVRVTVVRTSSRTASPIEVAPVSPIVDFQDVPAEDDDQRRILSSRDSNDIPLFSPDIYGQDLFFPSGTVGSVSVGEMSGYVLVNIQTAPVRYNDERQTLEITQTAEIEIEFQCTVADPPTTMVPADTRVRDLVLEQGLQPWNQIEAVYAPLIADWDPLEVLVLNGSTGVTIDENTTYLIVTSQEIYADRLLNGLREFVEHKELLGEVVMVAAVEDIYDTCNGIDEQEKIKQFIWTCKLTSELRNVLLLGNPDPNAQGAGVPVPDPGLVPMRNCTVASGDDGATQSALTDMYYTDYAASWFKDWDSDDDQLYGESWNGGIGRPDLVVGRIAPVGGYVADVLYQGGGTELVVTAREKLRTVFHKLIRYDRQIDKSWRHNQLALSSWMYGIGPEDEYGLYYGNAALTLYYTWYYTSVADGSFLSHLDQVTQSAYDFVSYLHDVWHDGIGMEAVTPMQDAGAHSSAFDQWCNNDYGLVYWRGHGSWSSVSIGDNDDVDYAHDDGYLDTRDGSVIERSWFLGHGNMDNDHPSVVYAASCNNFSTGTGAYSKGDHALQRAKWGSLAQALLYDGGAVAVIGATNTTASEVACPAYPVTGQSAWYQREFFVSLAEGMSFGEAFLASKVAAQEYYDGDTEHKTKLRDWLRINLLADPAQTLFSEIPDDAYETAANGENDDKETATALFSGVSSGAYAKYGYAMIRRDDLVCLDDDWYVLSDLGTGRKALVISVERDLDRWDDVQLAAYPAAYGVLTGAETSTDNARSLTIAETAETDIYIRVGERDYATDYNLVIEIENLDSGFRRGD